MIQNRGMELAFDLVLAAIGGALLNFTFKNMVNIIFCIGIRMGESL